MLKAHGAQRAQGSVILLVGSHSIFFSLEFNKIPATLKNFEHIEMFVKLKNCIIIHLQKVSQSFGRYVCIRLPNWPFEFSFFFLSQDTQYEALYPCTDKRYTGKRKNLNKLRTNFSVSNSRSTYKLFTIWKSVGKNICHIHRIGKRAKGKVRSEKRMKLISVWRIKNRIYMLNWCALCQTKQTADFKKVIQKLHTGIRETISFGCDMEKKPQTHFESNSNITVA